MAARPAAPSLPPSHPRPLSLLASSLLLGSLSSLAASPLVAQADEAKATLPTVRVEANAEPSAKDTLQAVTSKIGKGRQELRDIPQSVTVVTEKLINDRNLDTFKEALHNTAGVSFLAAEGGEEDIRLRGFSLQASGDIFVDGMRDPAFYERDTFNYDRLEVLRGSASMLFGRGSTGGAANQVSKEPTLYGRNELTATIGSGRYARIEGDFNVKTGDNAALRVATMWNGSKAFGQYGAGLDKKGIAPSFRFGIGTSDEFLISAYHLENHNGINYGLPWVQPAPGATNRSLLNVDPKNYYGMASDYNGGKADFITLSHVHRFDDGGELQTRYRSGSFVRDQRASAVRFCQRRVTPGTGVVTNPGCPSTSPTAASINANTLFTRGTNNKAMELDTQMLQSDYSGSFNAFGYKNTLLAGLDYTSDEFDNFSLTLPAGVLLNKPYTSLGTPADGASVDESRRIRLKNGDFESRALGLYAQDTLQLHEHWKLIGGLRWDKFEGSYRSFATSASATQAIGQQLGMLERTDSLWSKRFGVLYQPSARASYHASFGTSFNTSGETYRFDPLGSNTAPEQSRNIELGAKFDSESGDASLRLALFRSTKYNERNRDEESVSPTTYLLSGQRHASGLEIDVAGRLARNVEIYVSYAWIPSARIDKGASQTNASLLGEIVGTRPGLVPKHSGTAWTTWQIDNQWRVGGGLNLRSDMAPQQVSSFKAPGYVTADLMAEYALMKDLTLKFNINNIANKSYADFLYRGHYVLGTPRNMQLSASYSF